MLHPTVPAGTGYSTQYPDMDFETYSEAGYIFIPDGGQYALGAWQSVDGKGKKAGLSAVGTAVYSEHPTTEVVSFAYNLKNGTGKKLWVPGAQPPQDLFDYIAEGGLIEAWHSMFEYLIWQNVCRRKYGWPDLPQSQLRDAMPKARAFGLPGGLAAAAKAIGADIKKNEDGKRLIRKFSLPRNPTKTNASTRNSIYDVKHIADGAAFLRYNEDDIAAEASVSTLLPDLSPFEFELWQLDQRINARGFAVDIEAAQACAQVIDARADELVIELQGLTSGAVMSGQAPAQMTKWLEKRGIQVPDLTKDTVSELLNHDDLDPVCRRVLEIRQMLGASSVKKLKAINNRVSADGRLRGMFEYYGAERTGRFSGRGPQPQNLPNSGPKVKYCLTHRQPAALCGCTDSVGWGPEAADYALRCYTSGSSDWVSEQFGEPHKVVPGCLRGLFVAAEGHDLICSDYSAIEAVVLAALAGEQWRLDVFNTHGKIYEMSAAKICGVPFEEIMRHKQETGEHHPLRKSIGKIAELASGYQGALGAWLQFGAGDHMTEGEIRAAIKAWRAESPNIVLFWRGVERAAVAAISNPGECYSYRDIVYGVKDNVLYCQLPSGRKLCYQKPFLVPDVTPWGKPVQKINFWGVNKEAGNKWMVLDTYGGKLTENIVQAVARDILANALINLERAGYLVVGHVHDEVMCEVPQGWGSIEEFEAIMGTLPDWCADWPVKAAGGWRGKRYRKD